MVGRLRSSSSFTGCAWLWRGSQRGVPRRHRDDRTSTFSAACLKRNLEAFALHLEDGQAVLLHQVDQRSNLFKVHRLQNLRGHEILTMRATGQEIREEGPLQTRCNDAAFDFSRYVVALAHPADPSCCGLFVAGSGRPDAAASQRGAWCGVRQCRYGEYFWRSDDACAGEVYRLVGGGILRRSLSCWPSPTRAGRPGEARFSSSCLTAQCRRLRRRPLRVRRRMPVRRPTPSPAASPAAAGP